MIQELLQAMPTSVWTLGIFLTFLPGALIIILIACIPGAGERLIRFFEALFGQTKTRAKTRSRKKRRRSLPRRRNPQDMEVF